MRKYWEIFKITWQQYFIYRVNFILWRTRTILQLLVVYFIWWSVFRSQNEVLGYTTSTILTYILVAALIRAIVLSTRVTDLMDAINTGRIVNFLIKPIGFFRYYIAKEVADKMFNTLFYIIEVSVIIFLLKPQIIIQNNIQILFVFFLSIIGALIIYFCINFIISLTAFWMENSWGPLFLMSVLLESLGGGLFPIDILPRSLFNIIMLTPFPYLIYFPAKLYLGNMDKFQIIYGFSVIFIWSITLVIVMRMMLNAGFRHLSAEEN